MKSIYLEKLAYVCTEMYMNIKYQWKHWSDGVLWVFFYLSALCNQDFATSDVKLFCPTVSWQNITKTSYVSVTPSDNVVYFSFSLLHWISHVVQMKGSQRIRLDRAVYSTTTFQTTSTGKRNMKAIAQYKKIGLGIRFTKVECSISQEGRETGSPGGVFSCGNTTTNWVWTDVKWYFKCCGPACNMLSSCQQEAVSSHFSSPMAPQLLTREKRCLPHAETGWVSAARGFQLRKYEFAKAKRKIKKLALRVYRSGKYSVHFQT